MADKPLDQRMAPPSLADARPIMALLVAVPPEHRVRRAELMIASPGGSAKRRRRNRSGSRNSNRAVAEAMAAVRVVNVSATVVTGMVTAADTVMAQATAALIVLLLNRLRPR